MKTVSIRREGKEIQQGVWELRRFIPGAQYVDPIHGWTIRSIGQRIGDNKIFAAVDHRFSDDPNYSCLYSEA